MTEAGLNWVPMEGRWDVDEGLVKYLGPAEPGTRNAYGIILVNRAFNDGKIEAAVRFPSERTQDDAGRILLGYDARSREGLSIGLGGHPWAFVVSRLRHGVGWQGISVAGNWGSLVAGKQYDVEVSLRGQTVALCVDGVKVIDHVLEEPLPGTRVGLSAWGEHEIEFNSVHIDPAVPQGFVVMEFSAPYDALYREVLAPVAAAEGIGLRRSDEIYGPGVVLQDIARDIAEAGIVVAEITPPNPNVFYELGYAHALAKPTILLARRGEKLPFDVASYRCIFYDDSIGGKAAVEREFRQHLRAILGHG